MTRLRHPETVTINPGPVAPHRTLAIPLTQGLWAWVDGTDAIRVEPYRWFAMYDSDSRAYYAARKITIGRGKQRNVRLHRAVLDAPAGVVVDHINGSASTLDNRRSNLRLASSVENQRNRGLQVSNSSGYKGVSFHRQCGRWRAEIRVNGHLRYLGLFSTAARAAAAYDAAALEFHGEFAKTNAMLGLLPLSVEEVA